MENSILVQGVNLDAFYEKIRTTIREEIVFQRSCEEVVEKKLRTRKETAAKFRITLPTLNVYTQKGLVKSVRCGYRVLYRDEDIENALREIPIRRSKIR